MRRYPTSIYNNKIWPLLPIVSNYGTYNRVQVKGSHPKKITHSANLKIKHRVLDNVVPWSTPSSIPNFKQSNTKQIHKYYEDGDKVIIIGGGNGVTAVHSAKAVGLTGKVIIYEADEKRINDIEETLRHNNVWDICEIKHAIVGKAHLVESVGNAAIVDPTNLPQCDSLEMDCEGAELNILKNINIKPNNIIVELHHKKPYSPYSSTDIIQSLLENRGYSVEKFGGGWVDELFVAKID